MCVAQYDCNILAGGELVNIFKQTYADLESTMRDIVAKVRTVPMSERPGTAHIDHMECLVQYTFYTSLVRKWLPDTDARILDWGGQHGQVTLLLSYYYPNTTCYVLEGDEFDRRYSLSGWHRLLGVTNVVRAIDPARIALQGNFDAAISSGVLEHVEECGGNEIQSLEELHHILKPGGLLFIWNLPRRYGREFVYPLLGRKAHIRRFGKQEIIGQLKHSGFEVLHISTHEIMPLAVLKRLGAIVRTDTLLEWDYWFAEHLPWLAQNFTIVARRIDPVAV